MDVKQPKGQIAGTGVAGGTTVSAAAGGGTGTSSGSGGAASVAAATSEFMCSLFGLVLDHQSVKQLLLTLENTIAHDTDWDWDSNQYRKTAKAAAALAAANAPVPPGAPTPNAAATPTLAAGKPNTAAAAAAAAAVRAASSEDVVSAKELIHYERVYSSDFKDASGTELRAWSHVTRQTHCENWHLHAVGRPIMTGTGASSSTAAGAGGANSNKSECLIRSIRDVRVDANYHTFLSLLGYRLEYEYVQKGWLFHADGGDIEIRVYQLYKFGRSGDLTSLHRLPPVTQAANAAAAAALLSAGGAAPGSAAAAAATAQAHAALMHASNGRWMVELRAICTDDRLSQTQLKLVTFGKTLHPLINFTKGE